MIIAAPYQEVPLSALDLEDRTFVFSPPEQPTRYRKTVARPVTRRPDVFIRTT